MHECFRDNALIGSDKIYNMATLSFQLQYFTVDRQWFHLNFGVADIWMFWTGLISKGQCIPPYVFRTYVRVKPHFGS